MFSLYESVRTKGSGRTSTNLFLQYKWDVLNYENHRFNIKTAKSKLDNGAPRTYPHLYYKPKKLQLELERFCIIQRDNKLLMDRLATIEREGAWTDCKNFHEIKSLNTWKRQQEMVKLAYSNQTMLNRLMDCHSQYNHNKLEDEYLLSRKHKANVEKFPKDWRKIRHQMKCLRKRIRAKVVGMRTGKYKEEYEEKNERLAIEKEALHLEMAEKEKKLKDQRDKEAKEKNKLQKCERLKAMEERQRAKAEWMEASKNWRKLRDERLQLTKEKKKEEEKKLIEVKEREQKRQKQRREEIKKEIEEWRKWKAEQTTDAEEEQKLVEIKEREQKRQEKRRKEIKKEIEEWRKWKAEQDSVKSSKNKRTAISSKEFQTSLKIKSSPSNESDSNQEQDDSKEETIETATIYFEGGQKKEKIAKDIVTDLQTDTPGKSEETSEEKVEEKEQPEETQSVETVFLEGGQKVATVEKEVVDDLRKEMPATAEIDEDIESSSTQKNDTDVPESLHSQTIENQPVETVFLESGQEVATVEKEVLEDLRGETPSTSQIDEDIGRSSTQKYDTDTLESIHNQSRETQPVETVPMDDSHKTENDEKYNIKELEAETLTTSEADKDIERLGSTKDVTEISTKENEESTSKNVFIDNAVKKQTQSVEEIGASEKDFEIVVEKSISSIPSDSIDKKDEKK